MILLSIKTIILSGGLLLFAMESFVHAHQAGTLYGVTGGSKEFDNEFPGALVSIDRNTGAATYIGTPIPGRGLTGLVVIEGRLIASVGSGLQGQLIEINPTNGDLVSEICELPTIEDGAVKVSDLAYDDITSKLYGIAVDSLDGRILEIDHNTCDVVSVSDGRTQSRVIGIDARGEMYAKTSNAMLVLNATTGMTLETIQDPNTGDAFGAFGLTVEPMMEGGNVLYTGSSDAGAGNESLYLFNPINKTFAEIGLPGIKILIHDLAVLVPPTPSPSAMPSLSLAPSTSMLPSSSPSSAPSSSPTSSSTVSRAKTKSDNMSKSMKPSSKTGKRKSSTSSSTSKQSKGSASAVGNMSASKSEKKKETKGAAPRGFLVE